MRWIAIIVVLCSAHGAFADGDCDAARAAVTDERWAEAEVLLDGCVQPDAAPWLADARARLAAKRADLTTIMVETSPSDVDIRVSTFTSGVHFEPRTLHVPPGTYVLTFSARGYETEQRTIKVVDRLPQRVMITLRSLLPPAAPPRPTSLGPWIVIGAGAAIVLGGVTYHALELEPERAALANSVDAAHDPDLEAYAEHSARFDERRRNTLILYGVGLATIVGGTVWRFLDYRRQRAEVSAMPTRGGAVVGVQWRL